MNTTIQNINSIIDDFAKEYGEWMNKKDVSMEEEMEIFKKHYYEFEDLYRKYEIKDDSVEDKVILDILVWIQDTVGEIYINWDTEFNDYYNPGHTLRDFVEKYTKGE